MRVLGDARHVMHQLHAVPVAPRPDFAEIAQRDRLAARHVDAGRDTDIRDPVGADLPHERVELADVDVTLERVLGLRVVRFVDDDVDKRAASEFLVQPGRREIHVARHVIAIADQQLAQDVLGPAALVCRYRVLVGVVLLDRVAQMVEIGAAGVRLVAAHEAGPLAIAHRTDAGVGQQVDIDVFGAQQERVVAGLADGRVALLLRRHLEEFNGLDLVRLGPGVLSHAYTSGVS